MHRVRIPSGLISQVVVSIGSQSDQHRSVTHASPPTSPVHIRSTPSPLFTLAKSIDGNELDQQAG